MPINKVVLDHDETTKIVQQSKQTIPMLKEEVSLAERAAFYKALGDETRLKIIGMLAMSDLCMCEIVSGLNAANSTVSHHLKLLQKGNVVTTHKEGKYTIYQLHRERVLPLLD